MIRTPQQIYMMRQGLPEVPCNRSSSSSSAASTQTNNVDRRVVNDHGISVSGDGNAVTANITDAGSVAAAFDFAKNANQLTSQNISSAVGLAKDSIDTNATLFNRNADLLQGNASFLQSGLGSLLDFAKQTSNLAQTSAQNDQAAIATAYQSAQATSTGQKFLVAGGLIIIGLVAVEKMRKAA